MRSSPSNFVSSSYRALIIGVLPFMIATDYLLCCCVSGGLDYHTAPANASPPSMPCIELQFYGFLRANLISA